MIVGAVRLLCGIIILILGVMRSLQGRLRKMHFIRL
jgi:hypothetical protein